MTYLNVINPFWRHKFKKLNKQAASIQKQLDQFTKEMVENDPDKEAEFDRLFRQMADITSQIVNM